MLRTELTTALKTAMKARDQQVLATLRLVLAAIKDRDIAARTTGNTEGIGNDEIKDVLAKMVKQRKESIALFAEQGRDDKVATETEEIAVISRFLPEQLDENEIADAVTQTIAEINATSIKDMGSVMAALKERYAGQMDFAKAGSLVKDRLMA